MERRNLCKSPSGGGGKIKFKFFGIVNRLTNFAKEF